ncbi:MAG: hypothetical protein IIC83_07790 [Chloroflexi bacterium]|nr:hypothetical protein [Chloroflexota bacterium]
MYVIRRVARTQPGKEWVVAGLLTKICNAYEADGRDKAQIYMGRGLPGDQNVVYAEWTQDRIEPNRLPSVPKSVLTDNAEMQKLLTSYDLEFYELVTPDKLSERGLG